MKKIILISIAALAGIAIYYSICKEEPIAVIDEELVDDSYNNYEKIDKVAVRLHKYVKDKEIDSLATLFRYPISRKYPTRDILNQEEFTERYKEIFDDTFCEKIISNPYNWEAIGWRGYMYDNGDLWVDYSDTVIMRVNVYSELAERVQQHAIEEEKSTLHETILVHATEPICSFKTKNGEWYGRIDYISPVDNINIQLALYKSTTPINCAPDHLVLGFEDIRGSAHNCSYKFNGEDFNFEINNPTIYEAGKHPYTLKIEDNYGKTDEGILDIDWIYWEDLRESYL